MTRAKIAVPLSRRWGAGMSILEALVAGAILAAVIVGIMGSVQQLKKRQRYVITKQTEIWAVSHLVEQVKSMASFRPNLGNEESKTMAAALEDFKTKVATVPDEAMPIVWSQRRIESTHETATENLALCPSCIGRLGYAVAPLANFPGYVLTIAISHPEIFMQKTENDKQIDIVIYKQFVLGSS